jgi:hypothetical protein
MDDYITSLVEILETHGTLPTVMLGTLFAHKTRQSISSNTNTSFKSIIASRPQIFKTYDWKTTNSKVSLQQGVQCSKDTVIVSNIPPCFDVKKEFATVGNLVAVDIGRKTTYETLAC